jgi:hypothetical protein
MPVEVELRADCKQANYTNVVYAAEESKVREAFEEDCWQGAKHQRLRREAQEERAARRSPMIRQYSAGASARRRSLVHYVLIDHNSLRKGGVPCQ